MKYLEAYRELHLKKKFRGYSIKPYVADIAHALRDYDAKTLLDYGCGQGFQYTRRNVHKVWGVAPTLYDPAVPRFSKKPQVTFDGVICTDVLEHIPEDELTESLREIFGFANKFVFFSVCTGPSKKTFPNGKNLHVTIHGPDWWLDFIAAVATVPFRIKFHEGEASLET